MNTPLDIERLTEAAIQRLRQALDARPQRSLLLLCDPCLADPIGPLAEQYGLKPKPLQFEYADLARELKPYTVWIEDEIAQERLINASLRIAITEAAAATTQSEAPRSVCAWLPLAAEHRDAAHAMLSHRAKGELPDQPGHLRLLRYWDPRVWSHLPRILGGMQHLGWFPQACSSWWIDLAGHLRSTELAAAPAHRLEAPAYKGWNLNLEQAAALRRLEAVNTSLQQCEAFTLSAAAFDALAHRLDAYVKRAIALEFADHDSAALYATLCHRMGGPIEQHPALGEVFAPTALVSPLGERLEAIEETTWERVQRDFARPGAHPHSHSHSHSGAPR